MAVKKEKRWDDCLRDLVANGVVPNPLYRILLYGPPRTGKSSIGRELFTKPERVTLHKQLPVEDLLGGYALINGTTVWQDGPAVRALRNGTAIVLDEVDQISGECRCILHALLDDPAAITLASGERVDAKDGYCVIATTNAQPSALPAPVLDRFDLILHAATLTEGLRKKLGELAEPAESTVVRAGSSLYWSRPPSVNLFLAAAKLRAKGLKDEAIVASLGLQDGKAASDCLIALSRRTA